MHEAIIHFLLPYALLPAQEGAAVLSARRTPALDLLIRHGTQRAHTLGEDFQRSLSHEQWASDAFGLAPRIEPTLADVSIQDDLQRSDDVPRAPYMLLAEGGTPGERHWACVQPVHVEVAHDHLMLIDPESLALTADEAAALLADARPSFDALGLTLITPSPFHWYVSGDALDGLAGASPLRATGRSIDIWLPHELSSGRRSRTWMRLQNEIQMAWHEHPVNQARENRRQMAVNSIWFHGQGALTRPADNRPAPFSALYSDALALRGLAHAFETPAARLPTNYAALANAGVGGRAGVRAGAKTDISSISRAAPVLIDVGSLSLPFIQQDWGLWLQHLSDIDAQWIAPALADLRSGALSELRLTLGSDTGTVTLTLSRMDLKKFWRRRAWASIQ